MTSLVHNKVLCLDKILMKPEYLVLSRLDVEATVTCSAQATRKEERNNTILIAIKETGAATYSTSSFQSYIVYFLVTLR